MIINIQHIDDGDPNFVDTFVTWSGAGLTFEQTARLHGILGASNCFYDIFTHNAPDANSESGFQFRTPRGWLDTRPNIRDRQLTKATEAAFKYATDPTSELKNIQIRNQSSIYSWGPADTALLELSDTTCTCPETD